MHELGIINSVIKTVEDICQENDLDEVKRVTLEIGEVSGILPVFIVDYWKWAVEKTIYLKGSKLIIEPITASTFCENCQKSYPTVKFKKICPYCKSDKTYLLTGTECNIKEIEAR